MNRQHNLIPMTCADAIESERAELEKEYAERQVKDRSSLQGALVELRERASRERAQLLEENERLRQLDRGAPYCLF